MQTRARSRFVVPLIAGLLLITGNATSDGQTNPPASPSSSQTPNIILMLADDQSWNGTSVQMHPDLPDSRSSVIETPNLERLAREGMRFSAAYAPAPVCSPTRASIMTGQTPARLNWTTAAPSRARTDNTKLLTPDSRRDLQNNEITLAERLQQAGYATAHFGKWHLLGGGPEQHGFKTSDGNLGNEAAAQFKDPNPVDLFGMADRAATFMHQSQASDQPFFIQLSWHALHEPENALEATKAKYASETGLRGRQANRAALSEDLDTAVGRVLNTLDQLGLAKNTYVIYTSDNGGGASPRGPLSGGKGTLSEGGIRIPFIIRGPGIPPDSWSHTPIVGYDLFPTFLQWARSNNLPPSLDGVSITPLLAGQGDRFVRPSKHLLFHFPHYQSQGGPQSAIYLDGYKLITYYESGDTLLFDISKDIAEQHDLSQADPRRTASLQRILANALAQADAGMPQINQDYDPSRPHSARSEQRRGQRRETSDQSPRRARQIP
ncbi:MAG: sulfatase [Phycisphaeraceae bacterium]